MVASLLLLLLLIFSLTFFSDIYDQTRSLKDKSGVGIIIDCSRDYTWCALLFFQFFIF